MGMFHAYVYGDEKVLEMHIGGGYTSFRMYLMSLN